MRKKEVERPDGTFQAKRRGAKRWQPIPESRIIRRLGAYYSCPEHAAAELRHGNRMQVDTPTVSYRWKPKLTDKKRPPKEGGV